MGGIIFRAWNGVDLGILTGISNLRKGVTQFSAGSLRPHSYRSYAHGFNVVLDYVDKVVMKIRMMNDKGRREVYAGFQELGASWRTWNGSPTT